MRPEVECCVPPQGKFPSGWRWAHARNCPVSPSKKVRIRNAAEIEARKLHPAGKNGGGW